MRKIKLVQTNQNGDNSYYALGDVEWVRRPTKDDPGICYPKGDAIPRDQEGNPIGDADDLDGYRDDFDLDDDELRMPRWLED